VGNYIELKCPDYNNVCYGNVWYGNEHLPVTDVSPEWLLLSTSSSF
jgi:hypothetical protein